MTSQNFNAKDRTDIRKDLTWEAYQDIRKMIFSNEMGPGQKIPYRKMAEGLHMSLTPVVQALKHMEFMGLVEHEQNRGFFIKHVTASGIEEAYRLRMALEPMMVTHAIENLDARGEALLEKVHKEYLEVSQSPSLKLRLVKDIQFHMTLAELSKQGISILILRHLFDFLYLRFSQELLFSRPHENAATDHTTIFEAVRSRDVKASRDTLEKHIINIYENAVAGIQERLADSEKMVF